MLNSNGDLTAPCLTPLAIINDSDNSVYSNAI